MAQSIEKLLELTPEQLARMNEKQLREVVSQMASAANKRLKRLEKVEMGTYAPAYRKTIQRGYSTLQGGKFGVKGKNLNQLRNEYKAVKTFLTSKTGSARNYSKYRAEVFKRIKVRFNNADQEREFWKAYNMLEEIEPLIATRDGVKLSSYGSNEAQRDMAMLIKGNSDVITKKINAITVPKQSERDDLNRKGYVRTADGHVEQLDVTTQEGKVHAMSLLVQAYYEQEQERLNNEANWGKYL